MFSALTAVAGFIRIPLYPVPVTLQTLFVYLSGSMLGARLGAASQAVFLCLGLIGLPVFAYGGGPGYILQPTFGYLLGFPMAAGIIGWWIRTGSKLPQFKTYVYAGLMGMGIIYLTGIFYLYLNLNYIVGKPISWYHALWSGAVIFVPGELLKIGCAAALAERLKKQWHLR